MNKGIYEAISGNFLDSQSLSLLNPYMVGDLLFFWFHGYTAFLIVIRNLNQNLCTAAQLTFFMVVSKSNVGEATV